MEVWLTDRLLLRVTIRDIMSCLENQKSNWGINSVIKWSKSWVRCAILCLKSSWKRMTMRSDNLLLLKSWIEQALEKKSGFPRANLNANIQCTLTNHLWRSLLLAVDYAFTIWRSLMMSTTGRTLSIKSRRVSKLRERCNKPLVIQGRQNFHKRNSNPHWAWAHKILCTHLLS